MKNRLVFRILGALSSGLIIASVFIPFVSVTGYSESLWETNKIINTQYLPIMIIVFGAIGVLAFAINVKTELAYASSGALLFYLITQTIPVINQNLFNTFGVGYYCLAAGTILTGIMAFLCNLRVKKKIVSDTQKEEIVSEQISVIDQIDKLYNDQTPASNNIEEELVQPISTQELPIESLQQIQPLQNLQPLVSMENNIEQPVQNVDIQNVQTDISIQNTIETNTEVELQTPKIEPQQENIVDNSSNLDVNLSPVNNNQAASNPVTAEFEAPTSNNPVIAEFGTPTSSNPVTAEFEAVPAQNPVTAEFNSELPQMPPAQNEVAMPTAELSNNDTPVANNPVTSQFDAPQTMSILPQNEKTISDIEQIEPLANENTIQPLGTTAPSVDVMADQPTNTSSNLDIFG